MTQSGALLPDFGTAVGNSRAWLSAAPDAVAHLKLSVPGSARRAGVGAQRFPGNPIVRTSPGASQVTSRPQRPAGSAPTLRMYRQETNRVMKRILLGLILAAIIIPSALAQQPAARPGGRSGGFQGMVDPARRSELMVERLAEDIGLNKDQRKQMKGVIDNAQSSSKPLQQELQDTRKEIKEDIKAQKNEAELDALHQKLGATYAKLAAVQSSAFADALKLLKDDQKEDADTIYDTLSVVTGSGGGGRGGMMMRGGPGGFGPGGFGPPPGGGGGRGGPGGPGPDSQGPPNGANSPK